jgi:hypothetical protein
MGSKLDLDKLLNTYIISINHPEVSGVEHFNLLQVRDLLYENKGLLTLEQQVSLKKADRELLNQAHLFYEELNKFLKVDEWRRVRAIKSNR